MSTSITQANADALGADAPPAAVLDAAGHHDAVRAGISSRLSDVIIRLKKPRNLAIFGGGGALIVLAAAAAVLTPRAPKPNQDAASELPTISTQEALAALDAREFSEARYLASRLVKQRPKDVSLRAANSFVRGAVAAYEAEEILDPVKRRRRNLLAARLLEDAREAGFIADREAEGLHLLGRSLVAVDRNIAARGILREALRIAPERSPELCRLLAAAYRAEPDPNLAEALRFNGLFLAEANLSVAERSAGMLQRAEILLSLNDVQGCRAALTAIPDKSDESAAANVLLGRILMTEASRLWDERGATDRLVEAEAMAAVKLRQAIDAFSVAQLHDRLREQPSRRAMYLVGVCLERLGDARGAADQFTRTYKLHSGRAEGFLANLALADVSRKLKDEEGAIAAYRRALADAPESEAFPNPWITRDDVRARVTAVYQSLVDAGKFPAALSLVEKMPPLFDNSRAAQLAAETHARWAQALHQQAEKKPAAQAEEIQKQAAQQHRLAGAKFAELAELRFTTSSYPQDLWQAATHYLAGHGYDDAIRYYKVYLDNEARIGRPQALVAIGEAHLARRRTKAAMRTLQECLELFPTDAAAYRARLLLAKSYMLGEKISEAKTLLQENLDGRLTPASAEWRDSLFLLGDISFNEGGREENAAQSLEIQGKSAEGLAKLESAASHFRRAANTYEEAVQRYPNAEQSMRARYHLAESWRRIAKVPRRKLRTANIEAVRLALVKEIQTAVHSSMAAYEQLQAELNQRQETYPLTSLESTLLRNCYFAQGDLYYELGQHEEAIVAYKAASNRYQSQPEALHAYFQIAACYRRMNRPAEARGALEQAKLVLGRVTADDKTFMAATSRTRAEWVRLLEWMAKL